MEVFKGGNPSIYRHPAALKPSPASIGLPAFMYFALYSLPSLRLSEKLPEPHCGLLAELPLRPEIPL